MTSKIQYILSVNIESHKNDSILIKGEKDPDKNLDYFRGSSSSSTSDPLLANGFASISV